MEFLNMKLLNILVVIGLAQSQELLVEPVEAVWEPKQQSVPAPYTARDIPDGCASWTDCCTTCHVSEVGEVQDCHQPQGGCLTMIVCNMCTKYYTK